MAYFKTVDYGGGVFAIWETLGVGSFLIIGSERALLIDTGYGFGDVSAQVRALTNLSVIVANSHVHPDHSMSNNQFERVLVGAGDIDKLEGSALQKEFDKMLGFTAKLLPPIKLLINHYAKLAKPNLLNTQYQALKTNDTIDLGGRVIEVIEMPGHTNGSIVFLDRNSKTIFVGDAVNRGTFLYTNPNAKVDEYAAKLESLAAREGFDWLLSSHSKKKTPFAFVKYYAEFLRRVDISKSKASPMPLADGKVLRYKEKSAEFGSVSVFYNEDQKKTR
jgi:glyoxylase-like metal-dependent hydrolase (beta-lactamase superfamily II)